MRILPDGLSRNRHVEITTKSGNQIAGAYRRSKGGRGEEEGKGTILYLRFAAKDDDGAVTLVDAAVDLDDVDTILIGPKDAEDASSASEIAEAE